MYSSLAMLMGSEAVQDVRRKKTWSPGHCWGRDGQGRVSDDDDDPISDEDEFAPSGRHANNIVDVPSFATFTEDRPSVCPNAPADQRGETNCRRLMSAAESAVLHRTLGYSGQDDCDRKHIEQELVNYVDGVKKQEVELTHQQHKQIMQASAFAAMAKDSGSSPLSEPDGPEQVETNGSSQVQTTEMAAEEVVAIKSTPPTTLVVQERNASTSRFMDQLVVELEKCRQETLVAMEAATGVSSSKRKKPKGPDHEQLLEESLLVSLVKLVQGTLGMDVGGRLKHLERQVLANVKHSFRFSILYL